MATPSIRTGCKCHGRRPGGGCNAAVRVYWAARPSTGCPDRDLQRGPTRVGESDGDRSVYGSTLTCQTRAAVICAAAGSPSPTAVGLKRANRPQGPNGLLLFAGLDRKNSAVELHLAGIIVQPSGPGPDPTGPKALWFRLMKRVRQPKPVSSCISLRQHRDRSGAPRARRKLQRYPMALRRFATPRPVVRPIECSKTGATGH